MKLLKLNIFNSLKPYVTSPQKIFYLIIIITSIISLIVQIINMISKNNIKISEDCIVFEKQIIEFIKENSKKDTGNKEVKLPCPFSEYKFYNNNKKNELHLLLQKYQNKCGKCLPNDQ